jgi:2-oxoglutarate ferredoxin oxidoreductase subunit beta
MSSEVRFTDFKSDAQPTWCPGCGDFGTMNGMMKALANTGNHPDETFVVAGIGCSGKIGTYMHSYALHGVHGRALPLGCGVKIANPDLEVMVAGGGTATASPSAPATSSTRSAGTWTCPTSSWTTASTG